MKNWAQKEKELVQYYIALQGQNSSFLMTTMLFSKLSNQFRICLGWDIAPVSVTPDLLHGLSWPLGWSLSPLSLDYRSHTFALGKALPLDCLILWSLAMCLFISSFCLPWYVLLPSVHPNQEPRRNTELWKPEDEADIAHGRPLWTMGWVATCWMIPLPPNYFSLFFCPSNIYWASIVCLLKH